MEMRKAAAKPKTTTSAERGLEQLIDGSARQMAKSQILGSLVNMSWRLAAAVLVPLFIGLRMDAHFHTKPSYTLAGFMLAIMLASYTIYAEYREIQANEAANSRVSSRKPLPKKKGTA